MSALVVDTSAWIQFFSGESLPDLEEALREARVILSPIVLSELASGVRNGREHSQLFYFLDDLSLYPTDRAHWIAVGELRQSLRKRGFNVSTPDAHVAQCAIETKGALLSFDTIFQKIAHLTSFKLLS